MKTDRQEKKQRLQLMTAVGLCVFGMILLAASFIVPPTGEIDPSVLAALAEILTFSGALIGIDYRYRSK